MTVVFESGFGQGGGVWKSVINDLGAKCRCITYARAGLGKSGTDGRGKLLLVGHSYGGLLATEYARAHPDRLQGLVLVDPATMEQRHEAMQIDRDRVLADDEAMLAMLPPNLAADYRALIAQLDSDAALAPHPQADVPVALLTSTNVSTDPFVFEETAQGKALWKRQHAALFASYMRGMHEYLATGHNIQREKPTAIAGAIRYVAGLETGGE